LCCRDQLPDILLRPLVGIPVSDLAIDDRGYDQHRAPTVSLAIDEFLANRFHPPRNDLRVRVRERPLPVARTADSMNQKPCLVARAEHLLQIKTVGTDQLDAVETGIFQELKRRPRAPLGKPSQHERLFPGSLPRLITQSNPGP